MRRYWIVCIVLPLMGFTFLDPVAKKNAEGNALFEKGEYEAALKRYREAQVEGKDLPELHFNAGGALYKNGSFEDAQQELTRALQSQDPALVANAYYNLGNTLFRQEQYPEAVGAYKNALKANPSDLDTKINLELALERLQQQQDQQQNQQQDQDDQQDQQDQNQDQQQNQQQDQDDQQDQQDQKQQQEQQQNQDPQQNQDQDAAQQDQPDQQDQNPEGQQPPPQPGELTQEDAERILDALKDREADAQKRRLIQLKGRRYRGNEW